MPTYNFIAQSASGAIERGYISGDTPLEVRVQLSARGLRLLSFDKRSTSEALPNAAAKILAAIQFRCARSIDKELLLQQLSVMLESGLELTPSLYELSKQGSKAYQKQLCVLLAAGVERGNSFAAVVEQSRGFPVVVSEIIRVGEETGKLCVALQRGAEYMEKRRQTTGDLTAALAYPLIVTFAACLVAVYLVGWAIPKLEVFLTALGRDLPMMTRSLLHVSQLLGHYGLQCAIGTISVLIGLGLLYAYSPIRYRMDRFMLRIPLIGPLLRMTETHELANSLALMLHSGVLLPEALMTASRVHRNQYLAALVRQSSQKLATGENLAGSLCEPAFAPMLSSMIAVGERTGDLPRALEHVSKFYAVQVKNKIKRLGKFMEPTIIVVVGGIVGYVYVAFFMALLSAGGNFK